MISDYYKGTNAATGSKGVQVLQGIKRAAESDLDAFAANNGPQLASAAKRADSIYKEQVLPYRNKIIANAIKSKEPDQIYKTMIAQGNGDRAENFYKALSPQGQAAVRSQMVKDAFEQATKVDGVFSPAQFAKSLENIKDSTGVFFKGQDKFELDGFTNLMRHIQRAGQVNENPPNGQRILMGLLGGEAVHGIGSLLGHGPEAAAAAFGSMAVGSAGSRALTKLFSSNAGKSLLLGASTMKPGSPAMERLIEKDLPRLLGASPNSNVTPFQPIPKAAGTSDSQIAEK